MRDFYCVLERYYKNPEIQPVIKMYQARFANAPFEICSKYADYKEYIFVYRDEASAKKHYEATKVCVELAYKEDEEDVDIAN